MRALVLEIGLSSEVQRGVPSLSNQRCLAAACGATHLLVDGGARRKGRFGCISAVLVLVIRSSFSATKQKEQSCRS